MPATSRGTLGIGTVLFPPSPGVFTAMGMLAGHVEHHVLRPCPGLLEGLDAEAFRGVTAEHASRGGSRA